MKASFGENDCLLVCQLFRISRVRGRHDFESLMPSSERGETLGNSKYP